jgi:hypothetical protein
MKYCLWLRARRHWWVRAVVVWKRGGGVFGVIDRVLDQLANVGVLDPVEHLVCLLTSPHNSRHAQLGQVLRDTRRRFAYRVGQFLDRHLCVKHCPQQAHPSRVGEHAEYLDRPLRMTGSQLALTYPRICLHA